MKFLVMFLIVAQGASAFASSELDNEINAFQVQLVKKNNPQKKAAVIRRYTPPTQVAANNVAPQSTYYVAPRNQKDANALIQNISAVPAFSMSVFDGADTSNNQVMPQGAGSAMDYGFSMGLRTDLNIFSNPNFMVETGANYLSFGSNTGTGYPGYTDINQLKLSYIGISLNGKWLFSGENQSSFYVKAGTVPMFLTSQSYSNVGSSGTYPSYTYMYANPTRFGNINGFDIALDVGVGYSYKLNQDLSLVAEVTGYQGLMPVMSYFNVYNTGITTGIGASYRL